MLKAAANSDSGRTARTSTAIKLDTTASKGQGRHPQKTKNPKGNDDDFVPVGKSGKAKYTFGGMAKAQGLAPTTRIDEVTNNDSVKDNDKDNGSDTSSELRLSYLEDVPLKTRFSNLKPPAPPAPASIPSNNKPLTITLPATSSRKPLRSVTDILRELRTPAKETPTARFDGGEVAYTPSATQAEATAFASALANANLPCQPSPPLQPSAAPLPSDTGNNETSLDNKPMAPSLQTPTNLHV